MLESIRIPVTLYGVNIGSALVDENGHLELTTGPRNALGRELFMDVRSSVLADMSLKLVPLPNQTTVVQVENLVVSPLEEDKKHLVRAHSWPDFRSTGLLWLINRVVFHPRGRALALVNNKDGECIGWQIMGDGKEVWSFPPMEEKPLFEAAERTLRVVEKPEEKEGI